MRPIEAHTSDPTNAARAAPVEALLNAAPLGVYLVDCDFRIAFVNPTARPVFGDVPDLIGRDFADVMRVLWVREYADEVIGHFRRVLETGEPHVEPERAEQRRDRGRVEYYEWRLDRVPLPDGRAGVVCYVRDISEQVESRRALARSEERYRTLFNSIDEGFCVIEMIDDDAGRPADYRFLETNAAFEAHTGLRGAAGRTMREMVPDHEAHWFEIYGRIAATGEPARFVQAAGPLIGGWYDVYAFRLEGEGSRKVAVLFRDITQRRRDEEALARQRDRLDELVRERTAALEHSNAQLRTAERMASLGTLAAGIGHDLGNLMLPMRERLDALVTSDLSPEQRGDVQAIAKAVQYLGGIVQGLRLLAQDPDHAASGTPLELGEWWREAAAVIRTALPRGVHLDSRMPAEPLRVRIGRAELTQAVFNLVQNAGNALLGQPGGQVTLGALAEPGGASVRLSVEDNGPGMSEDVRRRCTEPFFTTKTRAMSTGLGLSLVQGILSRAGGGLEVRSQPGKGSVFTLVLPREADQTGQETGHAFVLVADPRRRAFVIGALGASRFVVNVVDAIPTRPVRGVLVIDADAAPADRLIMFAEAGGRVLVLGDAAGLDAHPGITTLRPGASVADLRGALRVAAAACQVGAASPAGPATALRK